MSNLWSDGVNWKQFLSLKFAHKIKAFTGNNLYLNQKAWKYIHSGFYWFATFCMLQTYTDLGSVMDDIYPIILMVVFKCYMSWFTACTKVSFTPLPDKWASSLGVNVVLYIPSSSVATVLLWISFISKQSRTHLVCSEWLVLRRFIPLFPDSKSKQRHRRPCEYSVAQSTRSNAHIYT